MKRYKYIFLTIAIIVPLITIFLYYRYYNMNEQGTWINQCIFHHVTGLDCPGCGGQRAFHLLLHGEFMQALRYNSLFIIGIPIILYFYYLLIQIHILGNEKYSQSIFLSSRAAYIFLILLVMFSIVRNIPVSPFIYLSPP